MLRAFLCHSSRDKKSVRSLYQRLRADGVDPWFDEENLLPGQDWQQEIPKAVNNSDVVIVCLSRASISKSGYVQKEIKYALDVADEQPEGTIFIIPLKLEECDIPDRLRRWQWVNIFEERGYERLMNALRQRTRSRGHLLHESTRKQVLYPTAQSASGHHIFTSEKEVIDLFTRIRTPDMDQRALVWPEPNQHIPKHRIDNKLMQFEVEGRISSNTHVILPVDPIGERSSEAPRLRFRKAGPAKQLFFGSRKVLNVAILVSGGSTPGTNALIEAIVDRHWKYAEAHGYQEGLRIYGLKDGFNAFDDYHASYYLLTPHPMNFDREFVTSGWATKGGSMLGTSKVPELQDQDQAVERLSRIVQMLRSELIDILYVIGGDGSMKATHALCRLAADSEWVGPLSIIGVPQTIHNDILWMSQSLGSLTTAIHAGKIVENLHSEIQSNPRVGVIQLPGDSTGFIVANAVQSAPKGCCDAALIPEAPFTVRRLSHYLREKIERRGWKEAQALIVIAESAIPADAIDFIDNSDSEFCVNLSLEEKAAIRKFDEMQRMGRINISRAECVLSAAALKIVSRGIQMLLQSPDVKEEGPGIFAVEPRHFLRAISPSSSDVSLGRQLGTLAVDSAMAGFTDIMISYWLDEYLLVPLELVALGAKRVCTSGTLWESVLAKTGQPANMV